MPRSIRLTSICSTVVMIVDAARRAERQERLAVLEHDRRRHRAARPLAGLDPVRVGRDVLEREVGQLVVQDEAAAGHDDPGAAGLLDGEGVLDDVAPLVGDGQVGRRQSLVVGAGVAGGGLGAPPSYDVTSPGGNGLGCASSGIDLAGPLGWRTGR